MTPDEFRARWPMVTLEIDSHDTARISCRGMASVERAEDLAAIDRKLEAKVADCIDEHRFAAELGKYLDSVRWVSR